MKKVSKLYHCTMPVHLDSILERGIIPSEWSMVVYMTDNKKGAYDFMSMRAQEEIRDETGYKIKGFRFYDKLYVLEINAKKINWDLVEEGSDYNPLFFKKAGNVYTYPERIDTEHIINVWEYNLVNGEVKEHGLNPPNYKATEQWFPEDIDFLSEE